METLSAAWRVATAGRLVLLLIAILGPQTAAAQATPVVLNLDPAGANSNRFSWHTSVSGLGSSNDVADASGTIDLALLLDPADLGGATLLGFRFDGGLITFEQVGFDFFLNLAGLDGLGLGGVLATPTPGFDSVVAGSFAPSNHRFEGTQGNWDGTGLANGLVEGVFDPQIPGDLAGGALVLTELARTPTEVTYDVVLSFPFGGDFDVDAALISMDGTIDARGSLIYSLPAPAVPAMGPLAGALLAIGLVASGYRRLGGARSASSSRPKGGA